MSHVWDSLEIEPSKAPTIIIVKTYCINCINMSSLYQLIDYAPKQLIHFYKSSFGDDFLREDYLEFVHLFHIYLGTGSNISTVRKPAGISRAR